MSRRADPLNIETVPLWVNGARRAAQSERRGEVTNPATGAVTRRVAFCNRSDIDAAVAAAHGTYPKWRDTPPLRRARILMRYRELLEEVEFWPQCPQYYEVQDRRGATFNYCAKKPGAPEEPPRPVHCQ